MILAFKAPYLSKDELRSKAESFSAKYNPTEEIPVDIEFIVESDFSMDIVPVPGLQTNYDVVAFITRDQKEIRVDDYVYQHRSNRYRFCLAHELAHLLLHADLWKELSFATIAQWKQVVHETIPEDQYSYIEFHANVFAGVVLVPPASLATKFDERVERVKRVGIDPTDEATGARGHIEAFLAKHFDVSTAVIHKRIDADGLWESISH